MSAAPPGETYTVNGVENFVLVGVGVGSGELGTLIVGSGAELMTGELLVGDAGGSTGTVTVEGVDARLSVASEVRIGIAGTGAVTVSDGASVEALTLLIGRDSGSSGALTLAGAGTSWLNQSSIEIAREPGSTGSLVVADGAWLGTYQGSLYMGAGGGITITGPGTLVQIGTRNSEPPAGWADADGFFSADEGTILVSQGARLESDAGYIGSLGSGLANMTVTGQGTVWRNGLSLYIGGSGNDTVGHGLLTVSDGAYVSSNTSAAGVDAGSEGTIIVTGEGSLYEIQARAPYRGNLRVGYNGAGTVIVQDGATLTAANIIDIATFDTAAGLLAIGAPEGSAAVAPGTVIAANGIYFGEGAATLVFNHTSSGLAFGNVMFGTGGEIRQLAGVTDLTADSPDFSGTVAVLGGTLKVNGILSAADVTVGGGGALGGSGIVGSVNLASGATLAPGNSSGTLTVVNNVVFQSGSTYQVEIEGARSDSVVVLSGGATISDGAILDLQVLSDLQLGKPYTILQTAQGASGSIAVGGDGFTVVDNLDKPLLERVVFYSADAVTVAFQELSAPWSTLVATPNQAAAANAVQSLGIGNPLFESAVLLDRDQLDATFDLLSGEINATAKGVLIRDSQFLRGAVFDRLVTADRPGGANEIAVAPLGYASRAKAPASPFPAKAEAEAAPVPASAMWAQGFGSWGSTDGDGNAAKVDRDTGGFFIGADTLLDAWRVGAVGGYGRTTFDVDGRLSSVDSDSYHFGVYTGASRGAVNFRAGASYSWNDVSTARSASIPSWQTLTTDYDSGTAQVFGELGYGFKATGFEFEPFLGLAHVNLNTDAFSETGGPAALDSSGDATDVTYTTLALRASTRFDVGPTLATLRGVAGWRHAFGDVESLETYVFEAGGTPFAVAGLPIAEDSFLLDISLDLAVTEKINFGVAYSGEFGDGATDQSLRGTLKWTF